MMRAAVLLTLGSLVFPHAQGASQPPSTAAFDNAGRAKTTQLLKELIRMDSSNPPGDTRAVAQHLQRQFEPLGVHTEIIVAPNGKAAHFIARLQGEGSKKPVLLAAHSDVVLAEREHWRA